MAQGVRDEKKKSLGIWRKGTSFMLWITLPALGNQAKKGSTPFHSRAAFTRQGMDTSKPIYKDLRG
jgi:hypothetical protein